MLTYWRSFVIQKMGDFADPSILDAATFAFFKGINTAAQNGQLTADVTAGLPAGNYRLASINTDANHAPAIAAVAQHGWLDDIVYVRSLLLLQMRGLTTCSSSSPPSRIKSSVPCNARPWFPLHTVQSPFVPSHVLNFHLFFRFRLYYGNLPVSLRFIPR
jgi:hypothetical protein